MFECACIGVNENICACACIHIYMQVLLHSCICGQTQGRPMVPCTCPGLMGLGVSLALTPVTGHQGQCHCVRNVRCMSVSLYIMEVVIHASVNC